MRKIATIEKKRDHPLFRSIERRKKKISIRISLRIKKMEAEFDLYYSSSCGKILHSVITYVLPVLQLPVIVVNLFSASVFSKWRNPLYRYLSINSTVDTIWLVLYFGLTQTICKNAGNNFFFTYQFQLIQLLTLYLARVVSMTSALISIQIAFDRFVIVTKGYIRKKNKMRIIAFSLVSFAFYGQMFIILKIFKIEKCFNCTSEDLNNSTKKQDFYFTFFSEIFQNHIEIKHLTALLHYLLTFTFISIMITLNVLIYKKYKKSKATTNFTLRVRYYNNEDNLEIEETSENQLRSKVYEDNRITLMVFWISCVFIVDQIISSIVPTIAFVLNGDRFTLHLNSFAFTVFFRSIFSILNTLFYYIFYHEYRKILKKNLMPLAVLIILSTSMIIFFLFLFFYSY